MCMFLRKVLVSVLPQTNRFDLGTGPSRSPAAFSNTISLKQREREGGRVKKGRIKEGEREIRKRGKG